jgi:hypothetical protein
MLLKSNHTASLSEDNNSTTDDKGLRESRWHTIIAKLLGLYKIKDNRAEILNGWRRRGDETKRHRKV